MSGRLASFRGPSTPTSSPVRAPPPVKSPKNTPKNAQSPKNALSPAQSFQQSLQSTQGRNGSIESTYHRKLRSSLFELRTCARTWDELVFHDGLRAAKALVDARTDLANELSLISAGTQPRTRIVGPKLAIMDAKMKELNTVLAKLRKQFNRMASIVDSTETLLYDASKTKGWTWVHSEPLWTTWTLEKFVTDIPALLPPYHRSLRDHEDMVETLRPHSVTFEASRAVISRWVAQEWLEEDGWEARWEELCEAEVDGWDQD